MREDMLVSICLIDNGNPNETLGQVQALLDGLAKEFRYFEVVYVISENLRGKLQELAELIAGLINLRIILTGDGTGFYQQRAIAASEAIGDVVAIVDLDELAMKLLFEQVCVCKDSNHVIIGWYENRNRFSPPYALLSLLSRHHVASQASRTIILPREKLNMIFSRHSVALDLRFEPKTPLIRYDRIGMRRPRHRSRVGPRYELLTEILMTGAPRYLKLYAGSAFLVSFLAILYAVYATLVFTFRTDVLRGWFSTSLVQSGSVFFIATGMSVLALAIAALLERSSGGEGHAIVGEIDNIDLFERSKDWNVDVEVDSDGDLGVRPVQHVT
jgi:hypothetical protein